jgi:hypothetical protein
MLLIEMGYALLTSVLPTRLLTSAELHFGYALAWTVFHTLYLGLVLHAQSTRKFLVRHFLLPGTRLEAWCRKRGIR